MTEGFRVLADYGFRGQLEAIGFGFMVLGSVFGASGLRRRVRFWRSGAARRT